MEDGEHKAIKELQEAFVGLRYITSHLKKEPRYYSVDRDTAPPQVCLIQNKARRAVPQDRQITGGRHVIGMIEGVRGLP